MVDNNKASVSWSISLTASSSSVCCHFSSLSYSECQIKSVLLHCSVSSCLLVFLNALRSVPGTIDLPLFLPFFSCMLCCFLALSCAVFNYLRKVPSPSPSHQIRQQTSKQLHFATQASSTHMFAFSSKHFHPDWVIFTFPSKISIFSSISNLFPE